MMLVPSAPVSVLVAQIENCRALLLRAVLKAVRDAAPLLQAFMKLAIAVGISDPLRLKIVGKIKETAGRPSRAATRSLRSQYSWAAWSRQYLYSDAVRECRRADLRLRQQDVSVRPAGRACPDASERRIGGLGRFCGSGVFGKHRDERPTITVVDTSRQDVRTGFSLDSPQGPDVPRIYEHHLHDPCGLETRDKGWPPDRVDNRNPD